MSIVFPQSASILFRQPIAPWYNGNNAPGSGSDGQLSYSNMDYNWYNLQVTDQNLIELAEGAAYTGSSNTFTEPQTFLSTVGITGSLFANWAAFNGQVISNYPGVGFVGTASYALNSGGGGVSSSSVFENIVIGIEPTGSYGNWRIITSGSNLEFQFWDTGSNQWITDTFLDGIPYSGSGISVTSASYALTASYAVYAVTSSYALTASYVDITGSGVNVNYNGTQIQLTASAGGTQDLQSVTSVGNQTTSSVIFGSGSTGNPILASGNYSFAQGFATQALGAYTHAEGTLTTAVGNYAHSEGEITKAVGPYSHAEGYDTLAQGDYSHAEGNSTTSLGEWSHAEGRDTLSIGQISHVEGNQTTAAAQYSHAEGEQTTTSGLASHTEGYQTETIGSHSHAEGRQALAEGNYSHAEGYLSTAVGDYSHAEGNQSTALGFYAHSEGWLTTAAGAASHAEGYQSLAVSLHAHAEGEETTAKGAASHAEGQQTQAVGTYSHAEGRQTTSVASYSHVEGFQTTTKNNYSHAEGLGTITSKDYQHVEGTYNVEDSNALLVIGDGTSNSNRHNLAAFYPSSSAGWGKTKITGSLEITNPGSLGIPTVGLNVSGSINISSDSGTNYLQLPIVTIAPSTLPPYNQTTVPIGAMIIYQNGGTTSLMIKTAQPSTWRSI